MALIHSHYVLEVRCLTIPRGKKYNAAEQHFLKEKQKLLKELKAVSRVAAHCSQLEYEVTQLKEKIRVLEEEKASLLKKLDMSPEDLEREKRLSRHADIFLSTHLFGNYGI